MSRDEAPPGDAALGPAAASGSHEAGQKKRVAFKGMGPSDAGRGRDVGGMGEGGSEDRDEMDDLCRDA